MRWPGFLLLPLLLIACTDTQAPIDQQPLFDIDNGPAQSGIVVRDGAVTAFSFGDFASGQRVTFGTFDEEYCAGILDFDEIIWADKVLPLKLFRLNSLNKMDDVRTTVWPFTAFDCDLFTTVEPVARGTSDLIYIDNDVFISENPNVNSYGVSAHGALAWTADGSPANLSFHVRIVEKKDGTLLSFNQKLSLK